MSKNLRESIENGEYFRDARNWYHTKYIHPFSHRSFLLMVSIVVTIIFCSITYNIYNLLPTYTKVRYVITLDDISNKAVKIKKADYDDGDAQISLINALVERYVINREQYKYEDLKRQFTYIKNNSTRVVFRRFFYGMNIDNEDSPILKYQKNINRTAKIMQTSYPEDNIAVVKFKTQASDASGKQYEDKIWQVRIEYDADKISINRATGDRFNFAVTEYELTLLKDNLNEIAQ